MHFWISKEGDVSIREQLTAQIKLAILSQDLTPGQKLPSTRELARRFQIHSNTVSAAYRELAEQGWVDMRAGSGIYVRKFSRETGAETQLGLDNLIVEFLQVARRKGFSLADIQSRIRHWLRLQPPDHFLVIDPNPDFREILMAEIRQATGFRVVGASFEDCANRAMLVGAIPVAIYGHAEMIAATLPPKMAYMLIRTRSVAETLKDEKSPTAEDLIVVASRWPAFLQYARSVLAAVKVDPDALSFRDTREPGWQKGLRAASFVITEAATAEHIPPGIRVRTFQVIADPSLAELCGYVERFLVGKPA
ncbi:MAG TPA: GntR family transcriptional regulator [Blastocatellia bacterium]|nr:GntR family transcriptional regulator [Blastocatellia bacterium]HMV84413.1 GntR family transcriptional regulator [Blastocatellia bacterium]HMX30052.1 GntR family transcriptional regulator [Blastocatellia bacterium]HMY71256.1 GntR family transcriptional regulator [Blastocatellia bacterium]HMZ22374.1 GntR family transcriptional regulator [Blastocatellia bacterium]